MPQRLIRVSSKLKLESEGPSAHVKQLVFPQTTCLSFFRFSSARLPDQDQPVLTSVILPQNDAHVEQHYGQSVH